MEIVYKGLGSISDGEDKLSYYPVFHSFQKDQGPSSLLVFLQI